MNKGLFVTAILFGLMTGYGAVNIFEISASYVTDYLHASTIEVEVLEEDILEIEMEYVNKDFDKRDIEITTRETGYSRIDKEYSFPQITANSFIIFDVKTGEIIEVTNELSKLEKNHIRSISYPIASITKLLTAIVVLENMNLEDEIIISYEDVYTYGEQGSLKSGEMISVHDLLHALLLESSNDAAEALARSYGRSDFMKLMNKKAKEIGMFDTAMVDPSGLSSGNISSVRDLSLLSKYIYDEYPYILEIATLLQYESESHVWYNNSKFRGEDNYLGGKNGYTDEALNTLTSIFRLPLGENSEMRDINIVILGSKVAEKDMRNIVYYLLKNIEYVEI